MIAIHASMLRRTVNVLAAMLLGGVLAVTVPAPAGAVDPPQISMTWPESVRAGESTVVRITGTALTPAERVTFDGVEVPFTNENFAVDATITPTRTGDLPVVVTVDGVDSAPQPIRVLPAVARHDLVVRLSPASVTGPDEVRVGISCEGSDPQISAGSFGGTLSPGEEQTTSVEAGASCLIEIDRYEPAPVGDDRHATVGFFDPRLPRDDRVLDLTMSFNRFTMSDAPLGILVNAIPLDQRIHWTYSLASGSARVDQPSDIRIRCDRQDRTISSVYGQWTRWVLPRDESCVLSHATPPGAEFSGLHVVTDDEFNGARQPSNQISVSSNPTSATIVHDVFTHPLDGNRAFVEQQYRDFLGREGDPDGVRGWTANLDSGRLGRGDLIQQFLDSPEFGGVVSPVSRLYEAYFRRIPDVGGLRFWTDQVRSGRSLVSVSDSFADSSEFVRTYGALDDAGFIDLVYRNVLGRDADRAGRSYWLARMQGGLDRGAVMVNFSESPEFRDRTSALVLVQSLYLGLLQRGPDAGGLSFWMAEVEGGRSVDGLVGGIISSSEYGDRFFDVTADGVQFVWSATDAAAGRRTSGASSTAALLRSQTSGSAWG